MKPTRFADSGLGLEFNAHVCEDCDNRVFRIDRGYFNIVDGRLLADKHGAQPCSLCKSGANMYLLSFDTTTRQGMWRCAQSGCGNELRIAE